MAQLHINNTKRAPQFDGTNYAYWKMKMMGHLKSINREVWKATEAKIEVAKPESPTVAEERMLQCNDIAISAIHEALDDKTFEIIKNLEVAHDAWEKLKESFEGTESVKSARAYVLQEKFSSFKMKEDESVPEMFHRLQVIVNDLKALGEEIKDSQFSTKFLRCLPKRFDTLITVMVKTTMKNNPTPNQVLQEIMADDEFREDHEKEELVNKMKKKDDDKKDEEKKKSVAFKATSSKSKGKKRQDTSSEESCSSSSEEEMNEKMALLVKKMGKLMKKKGYRSRRKRSSSNTKEHSMKCFRCHSKEHLIANCPYDSSDEDAVKKEKKKQKKKFEKNDFSHKKKKGESHVATWDSDSSSSSSDEDEDDSKSKKKGHASIAIQEKISLFGAPSTCFMAKAAKVQPDSDDDDSDDDEPTKDELITMLEDCKDGFKSSRKECRGLRKDKENLEQELRELRASYESLKEDHKKLQHAHSKLEKAHSSLSEKHDKEQSQVVVVEKCDVGLTCDILDESFFKPIIVQNANPSCSSSSTTTQSTSSTSDSSLKVENDALKREVDELNHALGKAYGGEARLLKFLGCQKLPFDKEGLGYTPKRGKAAFVTPKPSFVRSNGRYCYKCKQVGHLEHECAKMNNNKNKTNAYSIRFDSCYVLTKGEKGVRAKYVGTPRLSPKKKAIWVPKSLVTNLQGPKQKWVPKLY